MALTLGTAPTGVKGALELLGESIGPCRSPVAPLTGRRRSRKCGRR